MAAKQEKSGWGPGGEENGVTIQVGKARVNGIWMNGPMTEEEGGNGGKWLESCMVRNTPAHSTAWIKTQCVLLLILSNGPHDNHDDGRQ